MPDQPESSDVVETIIVEASSEAAACSTVTLANELMASNDNEEQQIGRQAATRVWEAAETNDELADWLRFGCGGETLAMVRTAGLELVGSALTD